MKTLVLILVLSISAIACPPSGVIYGIAVREATEGYYRGVSRARITAWSAAHGYESTLTNLFGYYAIPVAACGHTYLVSAESKLAKFDEPAVIVQMFETEIELNFIDSFEKGD